MNVAIAMLLVLVLLRFADTVAFTEYTPLRFGVTIKSTNEEAPDCRVWIWQVTEFWAGAPHVPEPAVPLTKVASELSTVPVTVTKVAGSGPSLATVNVIVTGLPAPIIPTGDITGGTQLMHKSVAGPSLAANALRAPMRWFWTGLNVVKVLEVVSPTK